MCLTLFLHTTATAAATARVVGNLQGRELHFGLLFDLLSFLSLVVSTVVLLVLPLVFLLMFLMFVEMPPLLLQTAATASATRVLGVLGNQNLAERVQQRLPKEILDHHFVGHCDLLSLAFVVSLVTVVLLVLVLVFLLKIVLLLLHQQLQSKRLR